MQAHAPSDDATSNEVSSRRRPRLRRPPHGIVVVVVVMMGLLACWFLELVIYLSKKSYHGMMIGAEAAGVSSDPARPRTRRVPVVVKMRGGGFDRQSMHRGRGCQSGLGRDLSKGCACSRAEDRDERRSRATKSRARDRCISPDPDAMPAWHAQHNHAYQHPTPHAPNRSRWLASACAQALTPGDRAIEASCAA